MERMMLYPAMFRAIGLRMYLSAEEGSPKKRSQRGRAQVVHAFLSDSTTLAEKQPRPAKKTKRMKGLSHGKAIGKER